MTFDLDSWDESFLETLLDRCGWLVRFDCRLPFASLSFGSVWLYNYSMSLSRETQFASYLSKIMPRVGIEGKFTKYENKTDY